MIWYWNESYIFHLVPFPSPISVSLGNSLPTSVTTFHGLIIAKHHLHFRLLSCVTDLSFQSLCHSRLGNITGNISPNVLFFSILIFEFLVNGIIVHPCWSQKPMNHSKDKTPLSISLHILLVTIFFCLF